MVTSGSHRYLATGGGGYVTAVVEFIIGILGRIVSSVFATYIVRLVDNFANKNDRHSPKSGH